MSAVTARIGIAALILIAGATGSVQATWIPPEMISPQTNEAYAATVCIAGLTSMQIDPAPPKPGNDALCDSARPVGMVANRVDAYAARLFDGWSGHVTVGPLESVPASAK